jgi:hypothetical protein
MVKREAEGSEAALTARQREWLRHLRACERSGETMQDYASRRGLSVQSLYQAGNRLRRRGVLASRPQRRAIAHSFVRVAVPVRPAEAGAAAVWRIRLPGGAVFESSAPFEPEALVSLLERLGRLR